MNEHPTYTIINKDTGEILGRAYHTDEGVNFQWIADWIGHQQ